MRLTGAIRKMDELGRIVLPADVRRALELQAQDNLEIFVDGDRIVLQKFQPACILCDSSKGLVTYLGRNICRECREKLGKFG